MSMFILAEKSVGNAIASSKAFVCNDAFTIGLWMKTTDTVNYQMLLMYGPRSVSGEGFIMGIYED